MDLWKVFSNLLLMDQGLCSEALCLVTSIGMSGWSRRMMVKVRLIGVNSYTS